MSVPVPQLNISSSKDGALSKPSSTSPNDSSVVDALSASSEPKTSSPTKSFQDMLPHSRSLDASSSQSAPFTVQPGSYEKVVYKKNRRRKKNSRNSGRNRPRKGDDARPVESQSERKRPDRSSGRRASTSRFVSPSPSDTIGSIRQHHGQSVFKANSARQYGRRKSSPALDHPRSPMGSVNHRSNPSSSRWRSNPATARATKAASGYVGPMPSELSRSDQSRKSPRVRAQLPLIGQAGSELFDTSAPITARSNRNPHRFRGHHQRSISHDTRSNSPNHSREDNRLGSHTPRARLNGGDYMREGNDYLNGRHAGGQDYDKAEELLRKSCSLGHSAAFKSLVVLGYRYLNGDGCEMNVHKAEELFNFAADSKYRGGAKALFSLGIRYWYGEGVEKDLDKMEHAYRKAASLGSKDAAKGLFTMGIRYSNGDTVPRDYAKAEQYYTWAAEAGYSDAAKALLTLGIRYSNGDRVDRSYAKAEELFEKAAKYGYADGAKALCTLGIRFSEGPEDGPPDFAKAEELCLRAADFGYAGAAKALVVMGYVFADGGEKVARDLDHADRLFSLAADLSHRDASKGLFTLGVKYSSEDEGVLDVDKAVQLMKRASDLGLRKAAQGLQKIATWYSNGTGPVDRSYARAEELYKLSIQGGNREGCCKPLFTLACRYVNGEGTPFDAKKAEELLMLCHECGNAAALPALCTLALRMVSREEADPSALAAADKMVSHAHKEGYARSYDTLVKLGSLMMRGNGHDIHSDTGRAIEYFQLALEQGSSEAAIQLGHCYTHGDGVGIDEAKAKSFYERAKDLAEKEHASAKEELQRASMVLSSPVASPMASPMPSPLVSPFLSPLVSPHDPSSSTPLPPPGL